MFAQGEHKIMAFLHSSKGLQMEEDHAYWLEKQLGLIGVKVAKLQRSATQKPDSSAGKGFREIFDVSI
ncbi:MAG: hypothetical protein VKJ02_16365 [Snowella sp.]|nr:hypothetical protein [Snowella sp.]